MSRDQLRGQFGRDGWIITRELLTEVLPDMQAAFESVLAEAAETGELRIQGGWRTNLWHFIDRNPKLRTLLDGRLPEWAELLLGGPVNYAGSEGSRYRGNTGWHVDGYHTVARYVKAAIYLDGLGGKAGTLLLAPGSHLPGGRRDTSVSMEAKPGDVIWFDHNIWHAGMSGSIDRRMIAVNFSQRYSACDIGILEDYLASLAEAGAVGAIHPALRSSLTPGRAALVEQSVVAEGKLLHRLEQIGFVSRSGGESSRPSSQSDA